MPDRPAVAERRDLVAAAAIRIIARDGVRALTHRAVDREAGIPNGSTSHHARTRRALLELVVDSLASRSARDALAVERAVGTAGTDGRLTVDDLASALTGMVESLAERRDDMRARYALILELHDAPALRDRLTTGSDLHTASRAIAAAALARADLPHDDARVDELIVLADSLVFHRTAIDTRSPVGAIIHAHLRGIAETDT
ncbi:TetR/AcrR family transcriptional regulator [Tsukamurella sp. 1534]|uniref:TetR/AcrR family transcriptional regulator n=1 Tax=Tsukamurella sp. 1534 TaxID=1151061 RepID=UPI00031EE306|nr:TetR family transcriptional regulator [Tsukamurella sp. 1534]